VRSRTNLIIHTRNMLKAFGIPAAQVRLNLLPCVLEHLPAVEAPVTPLLESLKVISRQI